MTARGAWLAGGAALVVGLTSSCARQGAPLGGDPDRLPPAVVSTRPDTFETVEVIEDPIRIVFTERISERAASGSLDDAVIVSPLTGEIDVDHGSETLEIDLSGGLRPGLVYRVTVLPVISDLFGNRMQEPFEFVFSTGGDFTPTALAGTVLDRVTGQPVEGALVTARPVEGDSTLVYVGRSDEGGIFTMRFLPPGAYDLLAFTDRNRDRVLDDFEARGRGGVTLARADTVITDVVILDPDTLAPRLARAGPVDSALVRLTFDDFVEPTSPSDEIRARIVPDSTTPDDAPSPPAVVGVLHPAELFRMRDSLARADSIAQAEADSLEAERRELQAAREIEPDSVEEPTEEEATEEEGEEDPEEEGAEAEGPRIPPRTEPEPLERPGSSPFFEAPLPLRTLFLRLDRSLAPGVPYRVIVSGVVNVAGLVADSTSVLLLREVPVRDTASVEAPGEGPGGAP